MEIDELKAEYRNACKECDKTCYEPGHTDEQYQIAVKKEINY